MRYLLPLLLSPLFLSAQLTELLDLPPTLEECSGLEFANGMLYLHNDGGNPSHLYLWDTSSTEWQVRELPIGNRDWEDISLDRNGVLWIADFGNNNNKRKDLKIYGYFNNQWITYPFAYEDQTEFPPYEEDLLYDAEALVSTGDSLFIFTKNRTSPFDGWLYCYALPTDHPEVYAKLVDSVHLGGWLKEDGWITAADLSDDGKTLALLSSTRVYLFSGFPGKRFLQGNKKTIFLGAITQKESLCWVGPSKLWIADERTYGLGGKLYELQLEASDLGHNLLTASLDTTGSAARILIKAELIEPAGLTIRYQDAQGKVLLNLPLGKMEEGNLELPLPSPPLTWHWAFIKLGTEELWVKNTAEN